MRRFNSGWYLQNLSNKKYKTIVLYFFYFYFTSILLVRYGEPETEILDIERVHRGSAGIRNFEYVLRAPRHR